MTTSHKVTRMILMLFIVLIGAAYSEEKLDFPVLKGPYMGQKPPGMTPEIFAPGIVSREKSVHSSTIFPPDGAYWSYVSPDKKYLFFVSDMSNGKYHYDVYWVDAKIIEELRPKE